MQSNLPGSGVVLSCFCLCVLCGCASGAPSAGQPGGPDEGAAGPSDTVSQGEVVRTSVQSDTSCRYVRTTGSHIATRKCYSREELEAMSKGSEEWLRTGGRRGSPAQVRDAADPREQEPPR